MAEMIHGSNPVLEAEANRLLRESMRGDHTHSSKKDILTPWKEMDRRSREVYVRSGVPDSSLRRGIFGRVASTSAHLNSRDGQASAGRATGKSMINEE